MIVNKVCCSKCGVDYVPVKGSGLLKFDGRGIALDYIHEKNFISGVVGCEFVGHRLQVYMGYIEGNEKSMKEKYEAIYGKEGNEKKYEEYLKKYF